MKGVISIVDDAFEPGENDSRVMTEDAQVGKRHSKELTCISKTTKDELV